MTAEEHNLYWYPAKKKIVEIYSFQPSDIELKEPSQKLASLLGLRYSKAGHWKLLELTDELKHTLKLINGPYSKTIIKILEVRNGPVV